MAKAALLTIGDEILIGQIIDTNSSWLGQQFTKLGIEVTQRRTVGDDPREIIEALSDLSEVAEIIFCTGGLGPTKDDKTKDAICAFFDTELYFDQSNFDWITQLFKSFGKEPREAHRQQSYLPVGCQVLHNERGTAPGMMMDKNGTTFVFTPGVPYEMKYIFSHSLLPYLKDNFELPPIMYETIHTAGMGESWVAEKIADIEDELPSSMSLAYLPSSGQVRLRLLSREADEVKAREQLDHYSNRIEERLGPKVVYGRNGMRLVQALADLMVSKGLTLTLAESCTGGSIAQRIVSEPGSSKYYVGSIVSYSNRLKQQELGVREESLKDYGAVSEQVVREMVKGVLNKYSADIALSVSGVAGPDGGTKDKPVGMIWMAVGSKDKVVTHCFRFGQNRQFNIELSVINGLNMIRKFLLGL